MCVCVCLCMRVHACMCVRVIASMVPVYHYRKYIGQIYTDSLVHDDKALQFLVSVIGEVRTVGLLVTVRLAVHTFTSHPR